jgi:hypothetical protein
MQATPGPIAVEPSRPTYGDSPEGQSQEGRIKAALIQANPQQVTDQMANQYFPGNTRGAGMAGGRGTEQIQYLTLDDGSNLVARFDTTGRGLLDIQGNPIPPETLKRIINRTYAGDFTTDPTTGQMVFGNKSTGTLNPVAQPSEVGGKAETGVMGLMQRAPKAVPIFQEFTKEVSPDSGAMSPLIEGAAQGAQAAAILGHPDQYNEVSLNAVVTGMARQSGEKGPLSESDKAQFRDAISWLQKAKSWGYQKVVGTLSPEMTQQLSGLALLMQSRNKQIAQKRIDSAKGRARKAVGNYYTPDLDEQFPKVDELFVTPQGLFNDANPGAGGADLGDGFHYTVK